jgi:hypothetical protein
VGGEDGQGSLDSGLMTPQQLGQYCTAVRDTAVWGGEPEILALSRAYNIPIHIVQAGRPPIVMHNPTGAATEGSVFDQGVARISYHRRMYGLGEVSDSSYESLTQRADLLGLPSSTTIPCVQKEYRNVPFFQTKRQSDVININRSRSRTRDHRVFHPSSAVAHLPNNCQKPLLSLSMDRVLQLRLDQRRRPRLTSCHQFLC